MLTGIKVVILWVIIFGEKRLEKMAVGGIFNFFGGWWAVSSFRNSPFRRYLSNGPCPVPQFALQPQFRPIFRILNFGKIMYYYSNKRRYDPPVGFQVFRFLGISGLRDFSGRILRKNSVPNDPFLWRLLPPCSANLVRKIFCSQVWRIPRCSFSRSRVLISSINNNIKKRPA